MAMTERDIKQMIEETEDFPALSEVAAEIVRLTSDLSAPVHQIAELLRADPELLEKMLTVINSPFYRFTGRVPDLDQAIALLGYKKVCSLAVGLSLPELFADGQTGEFDYRKFWERAICTAVAAGEIASHLKGDLPVEAFTIGLLQEVGKLLLVHCRPFGYGQAVACARERHEPVVYAEREILGIDHAAVGALLCSHWKLPQLLADVIQDHHFFELEAPIPPPLKSAIQVANLSSLMTDIFYEEGPESRKQVLFKRAQEFFKFAPSLTNDLLERIPEQTQEIGSAFALRIGQAAESEKRSSALYYDRCPECDAAPCKGKFCSHCGASLSVVSKYLRPKTNKILIVEDSAATRLALSILARKLGYECLEAFNGMEALEIAREEMPGMIMMDISMPRMNGLETLKKIREERTTAQIPVVMLTSLTDNETVAKALHAGADDYVVKPFDASLIQDRLKRFLPLSDA